MASFTGAFWKIINTAAANTAAKKKIEPGERVSIQIEFVTPPIEGSYKLLWRIMEKEGRPAFQERRQMEVMLNLI